MYESTCNLPMWFKYSAVSIAWQVQPTDASWGTQHVGFTALPCKATFSIPATNLLSPGSQGSPCVFEVWLSGNLWLPVPAHWSWNKCVQGLEQQCGSGRLVAAMPLNLRNRGYCFINFTDPNFARTQLVFFVAWCRWELHFWTQTRWCAWIVGITVNHWYRQFSRHPARVMPGFTLSILPSHRCWSWGLDVEACLWGTKDGKAWWERLAWSPGELSIVSSHKVLLFGEKT